MIDRAQQEREDHQRVERLFTRIGPGDAPTSVEQGRIESRMWESVGADTAPTYDTPPTSLTFSTPGGPESKPGRDLRRWLVAAMLLFIIAPGVVYLAAQRGEVDAPATADTQPVPIATLPEPSPPTRSFVFDIDGLGVEMATSVDTRVVVEATDVVVLEAVDTFSRFDPDSSFGQVVIARPSELFDGDAPETWFEVNDIDAIPLRLDTGSKIIEGWNAIVRDAAAQCAPGMSCVEFAELRNNPGVLSLAAGVNNDIRFIETPDGGEPLVVFTIHIGVRRGALIGPAGILRDEVLASLQFVSEG